MWFFIGLVIGAVLLVLVFLLRRWKIKVTSYEWFIGTLGLLLLLFTIQNFMASFSEHEGYAAWTFLWMLGTPALVLIGTAFLLPWLRYRRVVKKTSSDE